MTSDAPTMSDPEKYWNEEAGPLWVRWQEELDREIRDHGERAMQRLSPRPGERLLDVGTGCGDTALALARRVAPGGRVTAIDLSAPMLERARARAAAEGLDVEWVRGDASRHRLAPGSFDGAFSRFGVMFFQDPPAAFAHLGRALRGGGRLVFVCWQPMERNPWAALPARALAGLVPPLPESPPGAPGPFALADPDRLAALLAGAGLAEVTVEACELPMTFPELGAAVDFYLEIGPAARMLREAGAGPEVRERARTAVHDALADFATADGGLSIPSASWVVRAVRH